MKQQMKLLVVLEFELSALSQAGVGAVCWPDPLSMLQQTHT